MPVYPCTQVSRCSESDAGLIKENYLQVPQQGGLLDTLVYLYALPKSHEITKIVKSISKYKKKRRGSESYPILELESKRRSGS